MSSQTQGNILSNLFHIVVSESHPRTEELFNPKRIERYIKKFQSIIEWALIYHNKDVYTEDDKKYNSLYEVGTHKTPHYHLIIRSNHNNRMNIKSVSKWFDIPENFIERPSIGGVRGFNALLVYFTHTSEKCKREGKVEYPVEEIYSNINVPERIRAIKIKSGKDDEYTSLLDALYHGRADLDSVEKKYGVKFFHKHFNELHNRVEKGEKDRMKKMKKESKNKLPKFRVNIHVSGDGGVGKSVLCDSISYALYPNLENNMRVFYASQRGSTLSNYEYQPIIIWEEGKSYEILGNLGGQGNLLKTFRVHPIAEESDVKYGSTTLVNSYNMINSSEKFKDFIDSISKNDEKTQYYRRFPIHITVNENNITAYVSKKVYDKNCGYDEYTKKVIPLMESIRESYGRFKTTERVQKFLAQICKPILGIIKDVENFLSNDDNLNSEMKEIESMKEFLKIQGIDPKLVLGDI